MTTPPLIEESLKFHWLSDDTYSLPLDMANFQPEGKELVEETRRLIELVNFPPGAAQGEDEVEILTEQILRY